MVSREHGETVSERLPPHDLDAEIAVLGSVLLDNATLAAVRAVIKADDFYSPDHQAIFSAMEAMADEGKPVDAVTLAAKLREQGDLEDVGGTAYLTTILEKTPSAANAEFYARIVADAAGRRRVLAAATGLMRRVYDPTSTEEERAEAVGKVLEAGATREPAFDLQAAVDAALAEVDAAADPQSAETMPTGIPVLDRNTGGLRRGQFWVIGGRPQHGKTALTVNIFDAALKRGERVLNVRYEERPEDILMRLASLRSGVPYGEIRSGVADNPHDVESFRQALSDLKPELDGKLVVLMHPSLAKIEAEVQRFKPAIVVLDTLQKATHAVGQARTDRHDLEVARLTAWLGGLAGKYDAAVIAVSQVGRAMLRESRKGLPRLEHLKESGAIEEDADVVVLCYWPRKEMLLGNDTPPGVYVLDLAKNRPTGFTGPLVCGINPATQKLAPLDLDAAGVSEILAALRR